jgi:hypothetical protein
MLLSSGIALRAKYFLALGILTLFCALAPCAVADAAGDQNVATCANESLTGFRAYLPDCRAYEMVSPSFKDGYAVGEDLEAVSEDGTRLLVQSTGAFAGTESDPFGSIYQLSRSETGWQASSVAPPAARFPASQFLAASTDLDKTLWALREPTQSINAEDLYLRSAAGAFEKIGPMVPPSGATGPPAGSSPEIIGRYLYAGASADLSHVLFAVENGFESTLWPGDNIVGSGKALYEYVGTGNSSPEHVGVDNEGHPLGDCSTSLGADGGRDTYNAVSANGEAVFFTVRGHSETRECEAATSAPEVTEVYARLGGVETVPVSEPTPQHCGACNTTVRAEAKFRGASQDGTKVFFETEQELLPEATTMNLYEYDFDGPNGRQVARLSVGSPAADVRGVVRVSEDGSHVYFVAGARLTGSPRGGSCLSNLTPSELAEEETDEEGPCRAKTGANNLYVYDRDVEYPSGHVSFVATLESETPAQLEQALAACASLPEVELEECEKQAKRVFRQRNAADQSDWSELDVHTAQATPNGRFLVFDSVGALTPGVESTAPQVYEYDAQTEELVATSVAEAGYAAGTASADAHGAEIRPQEFAAERGLQPSQVNTDLAVSIDGATVLFNSTGALTPEATGAAAAGADSAYVYRSTGAIADGKVFLISDGRETAGGHTGALAMSSSGRDVFFTTGDPLLPADTDSQTDLYDARVEGGFESAVPMAGCDGEACQGIVLAPPLLGSPSSATTSAATDTATATPPHALPKPRKVPSGQARKVAAAVRACRRRRGRQRARCETLARKRYQGKRSSTAAGGGR